MSFGGRALPGPTGGNLALITSLSRSHGRGGNKGTEGKETEEERKEGIVGREEKVKLLTHSWRLSRVGA